MAGKWQSWKNNSGFLTPSSDSFYSYRYGGNKKNVKGKVSRVIIHDRRQMR